MKRCPYCDGEIRENAIKCKHCGSMLDGHGADTLDKRITMPGEQPLHQYDTLDVSATQGQDATILARQYRIVKKIGEGGMGVVYLAEDMEMGNRLVAIKVLPPLLARNIRAVENLRREALTTIILNHLNIVRLYGFHSDGDIRFLVMEYIDGQTLDDKLARSPESKLNFDETIAIVEKVALALDYAHSRKNPVFHLDLKPSNIMINSNGETKLLDFGIAREMHDSYTRVTGKQDTSGTLPYMSPDQLQGNTPSAAMDIYALGAVCYECLSGHPPFYTGELTYQIFNKEPASVEGIAENINNVLKLALAKNCLNRPKTAKNLIELLKKQPQANTAREQLITKSTLRQLRPIHDNLWPTLWGFKFSSFDIAVIGFMIIFYVPLSIYGGINHWAGNTDFLPIAMLASGSVLVIFQSIRHASLISGMIYGGLVPLLTIGPSLFLFPNEIKAFFVLFLIGSAFGAFLSFISCFFKKSH